MHRWLWIVVLLSLTGCSGRVMNVQKVDRHGHYRNDRLSFCLHVPETWEMREDLMGQPAVFLSPAHGPDRFRENLVVSSLPATDAAAMREDARKQLATEVKDFKEVGAGDSPEGYPWLCYTHSLLGKPVTVLAFFAVHDGKGLILSFSSPTEEYSAWESTFREIPGTLKQDLSQCPPEPSPGASPAAGTPTPGAATPATPATETPTPASDTLTPAAQTPSGTPTP